MTSSAPPPTHATSHVTTHVLDTARGRPAADLPVHLEVWREPSWESIGLQSTDSDGRCTDLGPAALDQGRYRLTFDTGSWFNTQGQDAFYPEVFVVFAIVDVRQHFHVPLLLSPFAYSTYRGS